MFEPALARSRRLGGLARGEHPNANAGVGDRPQILQHIGKLAKDFPDSVRFEPPPRPLDVALPTVRLDPVESGQNASDIVGALAAGEFGEKGAPPARRPDGRLDRSEFGFEEG